MQGRRLPNLDFSDKECFPYDRFLPGDYGKIDGTWYCRPPGEKTYVGSIVKHTVIEHEDGTITVSSSILFHGDECFGGWHGYLERGIWRIC